MDLTTWRAARRETKILPSGLAVTLQRVDLQTLLFEGKIPKPLLGLIRDLAEGQAELDFSDTASIVTNAEKLPELLELFNVVAKAAVVEPPLADVADTDHLAAGELSLSDRQEIFTWAAQGAQAIAPFPESAGGSSDPGRDGAAVSPASERVGGDR